MNVKIETDGTVEGTRVINLRTGEPLKNIKVVDYEVVKDDNDLAEIFHSVTIKSKCDEHKKVYSKHDCKCCWVCEVCEEIGCDNFFMFCPKFISENVD